MRYRRYTAGTVVTAALITLVLLGVGAASADASNVTFAPCYGAGGEWDYVPLVRKPRKCDFNGDTAIHDIPIGEMRWRGWGGPTACGRGTFYANGGFQARTRFCLYAKRGYEHGADTYTRIRGVVGKGCGWTADGQRCGLGHRFRFRVSTW